MTCITRSGAAVLLTLYVASGCADMNDGRGKCETNELMKSNRLEAGAIPPKSKAGRDAIPEDPRPERVLPARVLPALENQPTLGAEGKARSRTANIAFTRSRSTR
jgi:hypothetical protein